MLVLGENADEETLLATALRSILSYTLRDFINICAFTCFLKPMGRHGATSYLGFSRSPL